MKDKINIEDAISPIYDQNHDGCVFISSARRSGNTTRAVDWVIQELFNGNTIRVVDHENNDVTNDQMIKCIYRRLRNEHWLKEDQIVTTIRNGYHYIKLSLGYDND